MVNPIDIKIMAACHFKLSQDEAASIEPGGRKDPWYQVIPCKYGQIYPYSETLLAVHSKGPGIRRKLQDIKGLTIHNWSDDGEAIFLFAPVLFDQVAEIVKPKRKRQLDPAQRQVAVERLREYHFKLNSMHVDAGKRPVNRLMQAKPYWEPESRG
jgi:hypothetical protein